MCSEAEAVLREETHDLSIFEKQKHNSQKVNPALAVKKYARSAADRIMDDPQTIRPPSILRQTVTYLVNCVLDADSESHEQFMLPPQSPTHSLEFILPFILDRLRAVQQDFSIIGQGDLECSEGHDFIYCHETSVKIQLLFANEALDVSNEAFDPTRNYKQLVATLSALRDRYSRIKKINPESSALNNETQFLSYLLFLQMDQPLEIASMLMTMDEEQTSSCFIQQALKVLDAFSNQQPYQWFELFKSLPYLQSCAMIPYLTRMRQCLLAQILGVQRSNIPETELRLAEWSKEELTEVFCFEGFGEAQEFFRSEGFLLILNDDVLQGAREIPKDENFIYRPHANYKYIEDKRIKDGIYLLRREILKEVPQIGLDHSQGSLSLSQQGSAQLNFKQGSLESDDDLSPIPAISQLQLRRKATSVELPKFFLNNETRQSVNQRELPQFTNNLNMKSFTEASRESSVRGMKDVEMMCSEDSEGSFVPQIERLNSNSPSNLFHQSPQSTHSVQRQHHKPIIIAQPMERELPTIFNPNPSELIQTGLPVEQTKSSLFNLNKIPQIEQNEQDQEESIYETDSESDQFSISSAIKRFSFSRWRNRTQRLEMQLIQRMQGRKANKNSLEEELLKQEIEEDELYFFGVAFVYSGEKQSQEKLCHALMQDLLQFSKFELVEFRTDYPIGPHEPVKAEHMLFKKGKVSFLCSKFSGLTASLARELGSYHYVFVMGFRNTLTLQVMEKIEQELAEFKDDDDTLQHFCLLNGNKGFNNDAFLFFIDRYSQSELQFNKVLDVPLRDVALFGKLKKILLRYGGSPIKYNYLANCIVENAPSIELVPYSRLHPFSQILCTYLPGVTELSRLLNMNSRSSLSEIEKYNYWSVVLQGILDYITEISSQSLYEMQCLPQALYRLQGFTVKKSSERLLIQIIKNLREVSFELYQQSRFNTDLTHQRIRLHFLKQYNRAFQDQKLDTNSLQDKLTKLQLEHWWRQPHMLPLLIPYQLFQVKFKECVQLRLPLQNQSLIDLASLIEVATQEFNSYRAEFKEKNKRDQKREKWQPMSVQQRLAHYEKIQSQKQNQSRPISAPSSVCEKTETESISLNSQDDKADIYEAIVKKKKKVEYLEEGLKEVETKLKTLEEEEMIYKQRELAAGLMLNLLDWVDQV